jgi:hypothetical protein
MNENHYCYNSYKVNLYGDHIYNIVLLLCGGGGGGGLKCTKLKNYMVQVLKLINSMNFVSSDLLNVILMKTF